MSTKAPKSEAPVAVTEADREAFRVWREMSATLHGLAIIADEFEREFTAATDDALAAKADFFVHLTRSMGARVRGWHSAWRDANGGFGAQREEIEREQRGTALYFDHVLPAAGKTAGN